MAWLATRGNHIGQAITSVANTSATVAATRARALRLAVCAPSRISRRNPFSSLVNSARMGAKTSVACWRSVETRDNPVPTSRLACSMLAGSRANGSESCRAYNTSHPSSAFPAGCPSSSFSFIWISTSQCISPFALVFKLAHYPALFTLDSPHPQRGTMQRPPWELPWER